MPPQRVQRMVQYSQPPRPARPGMIFSTARPPLHCGQLDSTGLGEAVDTSSSDGIGGSLAAQPETIDMALGVGDGFFGIVPGKADIKGREGDAVDHDRSLVRPADSRMPQALPRLEGLNVKTVVEARHLGLRILLDCDENTERRGSL